MAGKFEKLFYIRTHTINWIRWWDKENQSKDIYYIDNTNRNDNSSVSENIITKLLSSEYAEHLNKNEMINIYENELIEWFLAGNIKVKIILIYFYAHFEIAHYHL